MCWISKWREKKKDSRIYTKKMWNSQNARHLHYERLVKLRQMESTVEKSAHIALPFFIGIMLADDSMKRLPVSAYPIEMVKQELRSSMFDCQLSTSTTTVVHMCSGGENHMSKKK